MQGQTNIKHRTTSEQPPISHKQKYLFIIMYFPRSRIIYIYNIYYQFVAQYLHLLLTIVSKNVSVTIPCHLQGARKFHRRITDHPVNLCGRAGF